MTLKYLKNVTFETKTLTTYVCSPLMLEEGTEVAVIHDPDNGIEGSIWVSDGYDCMKHFVDYKGKRYESWKSFPKELQDEIMHHDDWAERLGFVEDRDYQEGCFDIGFSDSLHRVIYYDSVDVAFKNEQEVRSIMTDKLLHVRELLSKGLSEDLGCIEVMGG